MTLPTWNILEMLYSNFYANVSIGTPPQNFSVLLKTVATGMWVPSAMCPIDIYDMCKDHRRYDRGLSSTYVREGQMFGYGGMVAELSYDTVTIGGQKVINQSFAEAFQYMYNDSSIPYDGLLGLGLVQRIFSNDSSIFYNMVDQGSIKSMVYSMYFNINSSDTSNGGALIIGGSDPRLYKGNLAYVNSTSIYLWQFDLDEVFIFRDNETPIFCKDVNCTAVPVAGSYFISADYRYMDILHKALGATVFMDDHSYQFDCKNLDKLDPIVFSIGGYLINLTWEHYVQELIGPEGEIVCMSALVGFDDFGEGSDDVVVSNWGLGDAFFTSAYVEFDAENKRLGFAQSVYS